LDDNDKVWFNYHACDITVTCTQTAVKGTNLEIRTVRVRRQTGTCIPNRYLEDPANLKVSVLVFKFQGY
jgi:hypothetical protein